eukprot:5092140-Pyramimonas_sp.AAC.1
MWGQEVGEGGDTANPRPLVGAPSSAYRCGRSVPIGVVPLEPGPVGPTTSHPEMIGGGSVQPPPPHSHYGAVGSSDLSP